MSQKGGKCSSDSKTDIYMLKLSLLRELGWIKRHKVADPSKPISVQIRVNCENLFFIFIITKNGPKI